MRKLCALTIACFLGYTPSFAQLIGCSSFLQGNHVELGINALGAFGSSDPAPAGYHPNCGAGGVTIGGCGATTPSPAFLGFVADPFMTGWTSYYGDYYVPGTPQEGWALQVGTLPVAEAYTMAFSSGASPAPVILGSNLSCVATTAGTISVWEGMHDSIKITQTTTVDSGGLYFRVNVLFTNLSSFPKEDVYYMRTIDPDNEQVLTGDFTTDNTIVSQASTSTDFVAVSARGLTDTNNVLVLSTHDSRAKAFIMNFGLTPLHAISAIHADTLSSYTYSGSLTNDVGIGITFNIGHLASVDSAGDSVRARSAVLRPANTSSLSFVYSFKAGVADTLNQNSTLAINTVTRKSMPELLPNPVGDQLTIGNLAINDEVTIYDITGKSVLAIKAKDHSVLADTKLLQSGLYIVVIKDEHGIVTRQKINKM